MEAVAATVAILQERKRRAESIGAAESAKKVVASEKRSTRRKIDDEIGKRGERIGDAMTMIVIVEEKRANVATVVGVQMMI